MYPEPALYSAKRTNYVPVNMSLHFCFADVLCRDFAGQRGIISSDLLSCEEIWWHDESWWNHVAICPKVRSRRWNTRDTCDIMRHGSPVNIARLATDSARLPSLFGRKSLEQRTPPASSESVKHLPKEIPSFANRCHADSALSSYNGPKVDLPNPNDPKDSPCSPGSPPPPLPGRLQTPRCPRAWPGDSSAPCGPRCPRRLPASPLVQSIKRPAAWRGSVLGARGRQIYGNVKNCWKCNDVIGWTWALSQVPRFKYSRCLGLV